MGIRKRIRKSCRLFLEPLEPRIALNSYFVSPTGNDSNAGTSAAPWLTLQHAANKVVAGDNVSVAAGTYKGFQLTTSGTASQRITFSANAGVIINAANSSSADGINLEGPDFVTIMGFQIKNPTGGNITRAGIRAVDNTVVNSQGVIIENNLADNCGEWGIFTSHEDGLLVQNNTTSNSQSQHGIYVSNASVNPVIQGNISFGNGDTGIQLNGDLSQGGTGIITGAVIQDNILHDNGVASGGAEIDLDGVQSSLIQNNLLYNNTGGGGGIAVYKIDGAAGSKNNVFINNTILNKAGSGLACLNINTGSTGNTIFNNILYDPSDVSISVDSSSLTGTISNNNVTSNAFSVNGDSSSITLAQWQSQTGQDKNSILSTPAALFVNAASNNYQLSATSLAVDAGVSSLNSHNAPTVDILGITRPQGSAWDIGAYERVSSVLGVATHFSVTAPSSAAAGSPFSITVTALDSSNNTATTYTGIVHFTSSDTAAVLPANYTLTAADNGVHTFNGATLKTAGTQSVTATDTVTSTITGSASLTVNPAAASSLVVSGYASPTTAGVSHSFTITAKDGFGNTATGYRGTVAFSASDGQAVLPANYTFTATDAGVHSFSATLKTAGSQSITGTDTITNSIKGSQTGITVNPAAASKLVVSGYPSPATAGASNSFTVTAQDSFSNTATGYAGTVAFTSSDGQAVLPANYMFTGTEAGVHSFSATLKTAGSQSITATDTVTATITGTQTITVNPSAGTATSFLITGYPSPVTAGTANNFTVTVKDASGNAVSGYTGTVTFTSTAVKAVLPANYTFTSADAGMHTFSATLRSAGTQSLTANDTVNASISGSETGIVVNPAATNHLVVSRFPSPTTAGVSQTFKVTAQDMYGNTTPSFADTVSFISSDSQAVLPANYVFVSADAGVHTFTGTLKTAGSQSITAQDVTNVNVAAGAMSGITVNPAAASHLQVGGFPTSVIAGTAHSFTVAALDIYGNVVTNYRGTVMFGSSDSQSRLPGNYAFTSTDAGVHLFSATLNTKGSQSIIATDTANAGITGAQSGIVVVSVQPAAGITGPGLNASGSNGVPGQPLPFTLSASETGLPSTTVYSYGVQWGDGSSAQTFSGTSGTQATHAFPANSSYVITVTATDPSGNGSLPASTSVSLTTLAMETDPYNANLTALYLGGTTGSDNIALTPVAGNGVKIGMNLVNYGSFFPTGHVVVYSQGGNDIIKTAAQTLNGVLTYVSVPVLFFAGNDINSNDVLNVLGSSANNVLVGGGGTVRLIGGQGQDLLIGGAGQATLQAGAGGDILIGGTTAYDNNAAALAAILAEWSRTDIDYTTRIAHLTGSLSGGLNGNFLLNANTVHSNGLADSLYGGAGMDWYFAGVLDVLFNKTTGEMVTSI